MRALITGGTGFIGSHLIECLRNRGVEVRSLSNDSGNIAWLESMGVEIHLGDINDGICWESMLWDIDIVYHLAGVTRTMRALDYYEGNYIATRNLMSACARFGRQISRFVYVSSQAAVGPSFDGKPVTEESPCHLVSDYGRSKLLAEREVLQYRSSLPITIIRPSSIYGPRERDMYTYMKLIRFGIQPLIGFKGKYLSLLYVDDLIDGILAVTENPQTADQIYMLGSEFAYTTEEIGKAIAMALNSDPVRVRIPHLLVYLTGLCGEITAKFFGRRVYFNMQKAKEAVQTYWTCSIDKAVRHFGFTPAISLPDGFQKTYAWYVQNHWL